MGRTGWREPRSVHTRITRTLSSTRNGAIVKLGFIGVGKIGAPMARRLLNAGHELVVHDANNDATQPFVDMGAIIAESPADVGDRAETVLMSLPTPDIVRRVVVGDSGLITGKKVRTVVDLSTTGVPTTIELSDSLARHDILLVDAPVSGGVAGAQDGRLALMVACPTAVFAEIEPMLASLGRAFYIGSSPGMGQTMKLLNNYLSSTALVATSEALVFGAKAGIDAQTMIDVVNAGSGRNTATLDKFPKAVLTGSFDYGFSLGLMCKDAKLFAEQAEQLRVPLWVGGPVRQVLQHALHELGGDADFTSVVRPYEKWVGVEVRSVPEAELEARP